MRREKLKVVAAAPAPGRESGYVLDEQVGFLLRVAMQRHTAIFTSRMIEGLTQTQFAALAKLHEVGPCSQNHLGRLICLDAATIKGVVDRLGARGFVTALSRSERPPPPRGGAHRTRPRSNRAGHDRSPPRSPRATLAPLTAEEQRAVTRLLKKLG